MRERIAAALWSLGYRSYYSCDEGLCPLAVKDWLGETLMALSVKVETR